MDKLILSDPSWFKGEPTVFPLFHDRELLYGRSLIKQANELEPSEAVQYIRNECKPEPGKTKFLVHAVAAGEFFGSNRNGDYFPWEDLVNTYKTFEEHACLFRNHQNKDKNKNFGTVEKAFLNHKMKRIELIVVADNSKCTDVVSDWENGKDIAVSMACAKAGTLIKTDVGFKLIEKIAVGDCVLTHVNRFSKVTSVMARDSNHIYEIDLGGWGRTKLEFTEEHPLYIADFLDIPKQSHLSTKRGKVFINRHYKNISKYLRWVETKKVCAGQFLAVPIIKEVSEKLSSDECSYARLLGLFIGDGSLGGVNSAGRSTSVSFDLHIVKKAAIIDILPKLANWTSVRVSPHSTSDQAVVVHCNSFEVAAKLEKDCGRSENKKVPLGLYNAPLDSKIEFLCGWFEADGWQDIKGLHWSTSQQSRAIDCQMLLASIGIPASCYRIDHPEDRGGITGGSGVEYTINVSNYYSDVFAARSKACVWKCKKQTGKVFISGDYLMVPIKKIERKELKTKVYNFSVETDESYTAYGLAVHNCKLPHDICSICKHKSPTTSKYCDHLKYHMNEILQDGRQVCAINPNPTFFDISFVIRPAERVAYVLMKAASHAPQKINYELTPEDLERFPKEAQDKQALLKKLSELEKQIEGLVVSKSDEIKKDSKAVPNELLSDKILKEVGELKPNQATKALSDRGIMLKLPEFIKAFFPGVEDMFSSNTCIGEADEHSKYTVDKDMSVPVSLRRMLDNVMDTHSLFTLPSTKRIIKITIIGGSAPELQDKIEKASSTSCSNILSEYANYKFAACKYVEQTKHASDSESFNKLSILSGYTK